MKKLLMICAACLIVLTARSQKVEINQLLNSIDWNSTESQIIQNYSDNVQQRSHFSNNRDKTMVDYQFASVYIGRFDCTADIEVDSITKQLHTLGFSLKDKPEKSIDALTLSKEMDDILIGYFGEPDVVKNNVSDFMSDYDRTWYLSKYIIEVRHMVFSTSHYYNLSVVKNNSMGNDFRIAQWGDSKQDVMTKEGKANLSSSDAIYMFNDVVAAMKCSVVYIFAEDKLVMAKYLFEETHSNKNDYIRDYNDIVSLMTDKYGKPDFNAPEWKNSLYKNSKQDYGFAVSIGHLAYSAGWFGKTTDITVALYGENNTVTLLVQYVSKKHRQLMENQAKQAKSAGL